MSVSCSRVHARAGLSWRFIPSTIWVDMALHSFNHLGCHGASFLQPSGLSWRFIPSTSWVVMALHSFNHLGCHGASFLQPSGLSWRFIPSTIWAHWLGSPRHP
ncbi:hypothetical protein RRG08_020027 [Elysia crispata]|uniref:Uncharacterized protein n=1 Tax=Elysia crispata TaxID=231223 RepID=A0AAE1BCQ8_9GAST|nr:hypothetical protein RRG08_020027 [Elysia crispata]